MKYFKYILFLFITTSCNYTSTPEEFINTVVVPDSIYLKDKHLLNTEFLLFYDSKNSQLPKNSETGILKSQIDTILYGPNDKMVFLVVYTQKNEYAELLIDVDVGEGVSYLGECFIAKKKKESIRIVSRLVYGTTSIDNSLKAKKLLREIYFREVGLINNKYNINDKRFWDSSVWEK
jgi:hypothetical protein